MPNQRGSPPLLDVGDRKRRRKETDGEAEGESEGPILKRKKERGRLRGSNRRN